MDMGGDERLGGYVAAGLLIGLGWGVLVLVNLLLHWTAPVGGTAVGPFRVYPSIGSFATAAAIFGGVSGALGIALAVLARSSPAGRFVLPGQPY